MIDSLVDAFMSVGVIVAGAMLLVGGLRILWGDRFEAALRSGRRWGPLVGSLLSFPPGCVGVLTAVRMYGRGQVSYGAAIAALTATMGDSAWLLLAAAPVLALKLKLLLCVLGVGMGYAVDALEIDPASERAMQPAGKAAAYASIVRRRAGSGWFGSPAAYLERWRRGRGDVARLLRPRLDRLRSRRGSGPAVASSLVADFRDHYVVGLFWILVLLGLALSIPVYFQLVDAADLAGLFGRRDLYDGVGIVGFALSCAIFLGSRNKLCCDEAATSGKPTLREILDVAGKEVAFVTVWTGLAFVAWEAAAANWAWSFRLAGAAGVITAALAGLVPACGMEILFASLFLSGAVPLSALITYLISEDGSGLIPMAALRPRSAILSTVITTVPALVAGFVALALGY